MGEGEMATIAELIGRTLRHRSDTDALATVRDEVTALCAAFPPYPGLAGST
jgi:glycine/serine hydroxymethyltransferase